MSWQPEDPILAEEEKVEQQAPEVLAMVLADIIHRDPGNGKFFILGTYAVIGSLSFPCVHPVIQVYVSLIDGRGPTPIKMVLIDADEAREPILINEVVVPFVDPVQAMEVVFVFLGAQFPEPGDYCLQLYACGTMQRELRLKVVPAQPPPSPNP